MKIRSGSLVQLEYTLLGEDGEVHESSAEGGPLEYLHGSGELPPAVEDALDGQETGFSAEVSLPAGEAFGAYDPGGIVTVPRSEFPEEEALAVGMWVELDVEDADGAEQESLETRIVEVNADAVVLDANHPLAGQAVTFKVQVLSVAEE